MSGWELHPAKSSFARHAADWDRLNASLYQSHPYYDSRFVGALLDHFASGREILCLYRDAAGIAAALILQPRAWGRWSSFRPAQAQITAVLLEDALLLPKLMQALPGFAWSIELCAIDPRYSPRLMRSDLVVTSAATASSIGIAANLDFDAYWKSRPKNLKANIRRYSNRLAQDYGEQLVVRMTEVADMVDGVARYGRLESAGWKGAAGTAVSADNVQGAFYGEIMRRFAASGQAAIYEMRVAGRLAASRLLVENEVMSVILKTTYDESLAHIAPGRLLLHLLIKERLHMQPSQTIEFYTNANRDQKEWASFVCLMEDVQIFRGEAWARAFSLLRVAKEVLRPPPSASAQRGTGVSEGNSVGCAPDIASLPSGADLADGLAADRPFDLSVDWFNLLQKHVYRDDPSVRYYFLSEEGRIRTVLPVRMVRRGLVRAVESLSNFYSSLYAPLQDPDSSPFSLRLLLRAASTDHGQAHVMRFSPMDPEDPGYPRLLSELRAIGWLPFRFFCFGNWYLEVKGDWEAYLRQRSGNLRSLIRRRSRDFALAGGTLEIVNGCCNADQIERAIVDYEAVYSASWKVPEPFPDFIPSLIRYLAASGMLRLGIARLQGRAVAVQLWIVHGAKASIFKLAYDGEYSAYSPGTVLTCHLLRHVIDDDRVAEVDYLIGDDRYKQEWMSGRRERWGIIAYNPRSLIGMALLVMELAGRTARWCLDRLGKGRPTAARPPLQHAARTSP